MYFSSQCFGFFIVAVLLYMIPHLLGVSSVKVKAVIGVVFIIIALPVMTVVYSGTLASVQDQLEGSESDYISDLEYNFDDDSVTFTVEPYVVEGDGDGTFRPEDTITRAETVAIINRMLGRKPHGGELLEQAVQWVDNPQDAWYYEDMLEATAGHDYEWLGEGENRSERWTALQAVRDWTALERYGPQGA